MSCVKTAEPIEIPFGLWAWGSMKHALNGGNFRGKDMAGHAWRHSAVSCAKWLNRSTCRLGCALWWVEGSMCYLGACWRHLANTLEPSVCGDAGLWQITLITGFSFDTVYRGLSHCVIISESCLSQSRAIFGSTAFLNC